jgi:cytochrome c oxidase subunit 4
MNSSAEFKRGVIVFGVLALLTLVEYFLGVNQVPAIVMWIVALVKAGLVIWFFMHVFRVLGSQGGH